jgi:hypothetical protein
VDIRIIRIFNKKVIFYRSWVKIIMLTKIKIINPRVLISRKALEEIKEIVSLIS